MSRHWMIAAVMLGVLGFGGLARADEASHEAAAQRLIDSVDMPGTLDATINQMLDLQIQQNPQLGRYRGVMLKFFSKYLSWDAIKGDMIKLYVDTFTEDELAELTRFYQTPLGKKAIKALPELTARGAQIGQKRVQDNIAELQQMIREFDAANPAPGAAAPPAPR